MNFTTYLQFVLIFKEWHHLIKEFAISMGNSPMPSYSERGQSGRILRQLENTLPA